MAQFRFRLQTLWKLRMAERNQRRSQLADAYKADQILCERREQLKEELSQMDGHSRTASAPGQVNVDDLLRSHRYALVLQAQAQLLNQQAAQVAAEMERRRQALADADRQVRILDKLRDKQYREIQQRDLELEIKQIDEVAHRRSVNSDDISNLY